MEDKTPKVSVIIPTYNRAKYITEAIESVLNQTYKDYEIIIIDDGSTDNTKQVLDEYLLSKGFKIDNKENYCLCSLTAKPYTLIRYIYQENKGEAGARNRGIREARGEYIAFLDSDDLWLPNKLKIQVGNLDNNCNIGMNYCTAKIMNTQGELLCFRPAQPALNGEDFLKGKRVSMTVLVRKDCFSNIDMFDEEIKVGVDTEMWIRLSLKYKIEHINQPLVIMRVHGENISNNEEETYIGHIRIYKKLINGKIGGNFDKKLLRNLLTQSYYLLSRVYFHDGRYSLSFLYSLKAVISNPLIGALFIQSEDNIFRIVKKMLNPYGILTFSLMNIIMANTRRKR